MSRATRTIKDRPERISISLDEVNQLASRVRNITDSLNNAYSVELMPPDKARCEAGKPLDKTFHGINPPRLSLATGPYHHAPNCFDRHNDMWATAVLNSC